jgi:hypothetical protein
MVRFSKQNAKTKKLRKKRFAQKWLGTRRKIYSFDLQSGKACPFALACKSQAVMTNQGLRIKDGPDCEFRCFSASNEVSYPPVYTLRKNNFDLIRKCKTKREMVKMILAALPKDAGIIRIHVGGDFFNAKYFAAWLEIACRRPDILFYAYTKAIPYWFKHITSIPENLVLTASYGGKFDDLIDALGLRSCRVVLEKKNARKLGLPLDDSDEFAANPAKRDKSFSILLHGIQPKGSIGGKVVHARKNKG